MAGRAVRRRLIGVRAEGAVPNGKGAAGTHMVMMEKNRMQLFREAQVFLEEPAS